MTDNFVLNISRFLLGGVFLIFGLNYFFNIMPLDTLEGDAAKFMSGLSNAVYFMPLLKVTEVIMGLFLIIGLYVPFVLVVLMPINLNILLFNLFFELSSIPISLVMIASHLYLAWVYRNNFRNLFEGQM